MDSVWELLMATVASGSTQSWTDSALFESVESGQLLQII
jgi:hypothetical protein